MIDVSFDFTMDSPDYWKNFWDNNKGLGGGGCDPDSASKTLQKYHQLLWSKPLPCGETMNLTCGSESNYLTWNHFRFGSDSILASFRYQRNKDLLVKVAQSVSDYKSYMEDFVHSSYTIGGMIIFPKHINSINQRRGTNPFIRDRWDLTLECIRRYYSGEENPLNDVLKQDKEFFDLFIDFKGYTDFFLLQDCLSQDASSVKIWLGSGNLKENPIPQTIEEYLYWIETELSFVKKRNKRIEEYCKLNIGTASQADTK
ncbi:MAG: hypothetical protein IKD69_12445 [Solobacterium sp.]|nr:hypothetical protein [Solobacterium sp.]